MYILTNQPKKRVLKTKANLSENSFVNHSDMNAAFTH